MAIFAARGNQSQVSGSGGMPVRGALFAAVCAAFSMCAPVAAAGLGELELMSGFNEPLRARVPLSLAAEDISDEVGIRYGMAEAEEFERLGLRWNYGLSQFQLQHVSEDGQQYIMIRSRERIREPVLSMVLYLETIRSGRILRTYRVSMPAAAGLEQ